MDADPRLHGGKLALRRTPYGAAKAGVNQAGEETASLKIPAGSRIKSVLIQSSIRSNQRAPSTTPDADRIQTSSLSGRYTSVHSKYALAVEW